MKRGIGRTTKQIKNAPQNSTFIWCNSDISYPKEIARKLGRDDIEIRTPGYIGLQKHRGCRRPIVIDHAVNDVSSAFRQGIEYADAMDLLFN